MITKTTRLSLKNNQLILLKDEEIISIPFEDICSVLIEDPQVVITSAVLGAFSEMNICLFTCNQKRLPNGVLHSFQKHSRQLSVLHKQYAFSKPFKKRIWQQIITAKLVNQSRCLKILSKDGFDQIYQISKTVDSGDTTNREAYGARLYFKFLFGDNYTRRTDNPINTSLNYGYSLLRGIIARTLVQYGFFPCLGIYHDNELNGFNLADDFIEAFRPVVDLYVAENVSIDEIFSPLIKRDLYNLLNANILMDEEKLSVTNAIE